MNLDLFKYLILILAGIYLLFEAKKDLKRGYFHWGWGGTVHKKHEPKGFTFLMFLEILLALFLVILGLVSITLELFG